MQTVPGLFYRSYSLKKWILKWSEICGGVLSTELQAPACFCWMPFAHASTAYTCQCWPHPDLTRPGTLEGILAYPVAFPRSAEALLCSPRTQELASLELCLVLCSHCAYAYPLLEYSFPSAVRGHCGCSSCSCFAARVAVVFDLLFLSFFFYFLKGWPSAGSSCSHVKPHRLVICQ